MSCIDEIGQLAELMCYYLDELTVSERKEVVEHYFGNYLLEG